MIRAKKAFICCIVFVLLPILIIKNAKNLNPTKYSSQFPVMPGEPKIFTTVRGFGMLPEQDIDKWDAVARRFKIRLSTMRRVCATKLRPPVVEIVNVKGGMIPKEIKGLRTDWKAVGQFLVDIPRRLLVCAVPKSGSTSWHRMVWALGRKRMNLSDDYKLYTPEDTIKNEGVALNLKKEEGDKLIKPVKGDDDFMLRPPPNSTFRIILARHPFARFISGWNQKFMLSINYWVSLIKTFPKLLDYKNEVDTQRAVSFVDFARFAAENQRDVRSKDAHFSPATKLCPPCEYDFTYIVKAESIDADEQWLMRRLGLRDVTLGREGSPSGGSIVNTELKSNIKTFMAKLSPETIRGLYNLYADDFEYFGYTFDFETLEAGGFD